MLFIFFFSFYFTTSICLCFSPFIYYVYCMLSEYIRPLFLQTFNAIIIIYQFTQQVHIVLGFTYTKFWISQIINDFGGNIIMFLWGKELFGFWIIISNIKMYIMKIYKWQQNIMENVGKFSFLKLMFVALKMLMVSIKYWTHIVFQSRIMLTIIPQWATPPPPPFPQWLLSKFWTRFPIPQVAVAYYIWSIVILEKLVDVNI